MLERLWVTNRVCGIGPSCASTSSSTESTIDSTRSTSPPKSAPRVSTMLIRVFPAQRGVLRQDRDATLLFLVVGVRDTLDLAEPRTERSRPFEQLIDEGGLAMVDVRDDGDVSKILDHGATAGVKGARLYPHCRNNDMVAHSPGYGIPPPQMFQQHGGIGMTTICGPLQP